MVIRLKFWKCVLYSIDRRAGSKVYGLYKESRGVAIEV